MNDLTGASASSSTATCSTAAGPPSTTRWSRSRQADAAGIAQPPGRPAPWPGRRAFPRLWPVRDRQREREYSFKTVKPGAVPWQGETTQAYLTMRVFARGMLLHVMTRVYFSDESANEHDPIPSSIADAERRKTLIAVREAVQDRLRRMDVHLQGDRETVFSA